MVKPWHMLLASAVVLIVVWSYTPKAKVIIVEDEPKPIEEPTDAPTADDWDFFLGTDFQLQRRVQIDNKYTYEARYSGTDIVKDLENLHSELSAMHEGNILIMIQSKNNADIITHVCENGKVTVIK